MKKQTILYKISFSALFIALTVILSRFFAIPGMFGLPFLKISLANSVVMFSSFYLGPIWGMIVGGASDTLGAILFPQGGGYNPIYTIPALLTGLCPFLFYKLFVFLKVDKKFPTTLTGILSIFSFFILFYFIFNDTIVNGKRVYEIETWLQITFIVLAFLLSSLYIGGIIFIKNKFKDKKINTNYNIYALASSMFCSYMFIKLPIGSAIQAYMMNYSFFFVFSIRTITGFFTLLVHTIIVLLLANVSLMFNIESTALEEKYFSNFFKRKKEVKIND